MTAPLFHLSPGALDEAIPGSAVQVTGPEGHHAVTVMRLGPGEEIQLSDTRARRASGVVLSAGSGELTAEIREVTDEPVQLPRLVLVQALAKDKRDLQAVESATELGIDRIIPWEAERSVARWKTGKEVKKHAEWVNAVRTAAKQTRRTGVPEVEQLHTTAQYLRGIEQHDAAGVVVLHAREGLSLQQALSSFGLLPAPAMADSRAVGSETAGGEAAAIEQPSGIEQPSDVDEPSDTDELGDPVRARQRTARPAELHLVVGPEGGISDRELEQLTAAGARTARLGSTVLRSSTAGPAALSAVQLLLGRWDRAL